jgi:hypothetical protein
VVAFYSAVVFAIARLLRGSLGGTRCGPIPFSFLLVLLFFFFSLPPCTIVLAIARLLTVRRKAALATPPLPRLCARRGDNKCAASKGIKDPQGAGKTKCMCTCCEGQCQAPADVCSAALHAGSHLVSEAPPEIAYASLARATRGGEQWLGGAAVGMVAVGLAVAALVRRRRRAPAGSEEMA